MNNSIALNVVRRRRGAVGVAEVLARYRASGFAQERFCRSEGIGLSTLSGYFALVPNLQIGNALVFANLRFGSRGVREEGPSPIERLFCTPRSAKRRVGDIGIPNLEIGNKREKCVQTSGRCPRLVWRRAFSAEGRRGTAKMKKSRNFNCFLLVLLWYLFSRNPPNGGARGTVREVRS